MSWLGGLYEEEEEFVSTSAMVESIAMVAYVVEAYKQEATRVGEKSFGGLKGRATSRKRRRLRRKS